MILPSAGVSATLSLLELGAVVLSRLSSPKSVSELWEDLRHGSEFPGFDRFVLTLTFLYSIGVLDLDGGLLKRLTASEPGESPLGSRL